MSFLSRGRPPFRADHIGSLRQPGLRQAFRDHASGRLADAGFRAIQDDAIRAVVARQAAGGLGVVNDGEYRRGSYWGRFVERTHGLGVREALFTFRDETEFTAPFVEAPVRRQAAIAVDERARARSGADQARRRSRTRLALNPVLGSVPAASTSPMVVAHAARDSTVRAKRRRSIFAVQGRALDAIQARRAEGTHVAKSPVSFARDHAPTQRPA